MTREEIYDKQIFPLMAKIIKICKKNKIPTLASFYLSEVDKMEDEDDLYCTTSLLDESYDPPDNLLRALTAIRAEPKFSAFTITTEKK